MENATRKFDGSELFGNDDDRTLCYNGFIVSQHNFDAKTPSKVKQIVFKAMSIVSFQI